jgi:hypothetical protein
VGSPHSRSRLVSVFVRIFGWPPGKEASQLERDEWTRASGPKLAIPFIPVLIVSMIVINQIWAYVGFGVWSALWLSSLAKLSIDIRRGR